MSAFAPSVTKFVSVATTRRGSDADAIANPWVAVPGVLLLVASIVIWVRDAGHEWRDTEQSAHDDPRAH